MTSAGAVIAKFHFSIRAEVVPGGGRSGKNRIDASLRISVLQNPETAQRLVELIDFSRIGTVAPRVAVCQLERAILDQAASLLAQFISPVRVVLRSSQFVDSSPISRPAHAASGCGGP